MLRRLLLIAAGALTVCAFATACDPQATTVVIRPTDDAQQVVNNAGEGANLVFAAGVHHDVHIWPLNDQNFSGLPGAVLDGGGSSDPAFAAWGSRRNVTVEDLEITNYAPIPYTGVVDTRSQMWNSTGWETDTGWTLRNLHIHHNGGSGQSAGVNTGSGTELTDSVIEHNDGTGIYGNGRNIRIAHNTIHHNAYGADDVWYHSGGIKLVIAHDSTIEDNLVTDNFGPGIWFDINVDNNLITGNDVRDNYSAGIQYELGRNATITDNHIENNGHGDARVWMHVCAVSISTSHDVVLNNNVSLNNRGGMCVFDQQTSRNGIDPVSGEVTSGQLPMPEFGRLYDADGSLALWRTENATVSNNSIVNSFITGASATGSESVGSNVYDTTTFTGNTYGTWTNWYLGTGDAYSVDVTFAQWQAAGNDPGAGAVPAADAAPAVANRAVGGAPATHPPASPPKFEATPAPVSR